MISTIDEKTAPEGFWIQSFPNAEAVPIMITVSMQHLLNYTTVLRGSLSPSLMWRTPGQAFTTISPTAANAIKTQIIAVKIKTTHFTMVALRGQTHRNLEKDCKSSQKTWWK